MYIDRYRDLTDGRYKKISADDDISGIECPVDFILIGLMGFCGCGVPIDTLEYVGNVLAHINLIRTQVNEEGGITWDEFKERGKVLFPTDGAEYFAYYVMDKVEFTEHGGSVPGWLSELGEGIMNDIPEILK